MTLKMTTYGWISLLLVVSIVSYIAFEVRNEANVVFNKRSQDPEAFEMTTDSAETTTDHTTTEIHRVTTEPYEDYCAPRDDIWPCECSGSTAYITLICSGVPERDLLDRALGASFPVVDMDVLYITSSNVVNITDNFLQGKTFEVVNMMFSRIESLDMNAFVGSRERLSSLSFDSNALKAFDFSYINMFPVLNTLDFSNNFIPNLDSLDGLEPHWKLLYLSVDHNDLTSLNETVFYSVPNVTSLDLSYNYLTSLPPKVFLPLENLQLLYLHNNNLVHLHAGDMWFSTPILRFLDLHGNGLELVDQDTFQGVISSPQISLEFNDLDYFTFDMFGHVLHNISLQYGSIDIMFNTLICDCDLLWVLIDDSMMEHVLYGSCKNHTYIHHLDVDALIEECVPGP